MQALMRVSLLYAASLSSRLSELLVAVHTHTHTHIYIYIYHTHTSLTTAAACIGTHLTPDTLFQELSEGTRPWCFNACLAPNSVSWHP
jgi:hypothetical protein